MNKENRSKKKEAIINTMVVVWEPNEDAETGGYWMVTSPFATDDTLGMHVLGADEDKATAIRLFDELLDDALDSYYKGELSFQKRNVGHPSKGRDTISARMRPDYHQFIRTEAKRLGITKGEFVEFITARYQAELRHPLI
jgi:hypothetical protein